MQPFVVTLCGLLIYRGIARFYTDDGTAGFAFGQSFPTLEWLTVGRTLRRAAHLHRLLVVVARDHGRACCTARCSAAISSPSARTRRRRAISGIRTGRVIVAAYIICGVLDGARRPIFFAMYTRSISPASHGNFYELYAIAAAVLGGCSLRGGEGSILGIVLGTDPAAGAAEPGQPARHPELAQLRRDGRGHPDRRARRPAVRRLPPARAATARGSRPPERRDAGDDGPGGAIGLNRRFRAQRSSAKASSNRSRPPAMSGSSIAAAMALKVMPLPP